MDNKIKTAYIRALGCKSYSAIKKHICENGWCKNMPLDIINPHIKKFSISLDGEVMFRPLSLSKYKPPKKLIVIPYLYFYKQPFKKLSAVSWVYDSKDNFVFQFEPVYDENGNYVEGYKEFETSFLDSLNSKKYSPVKNLQLELINKITLGINGRPIIIIRGWGNLTGAGAHNFSSVKAAKIQDMFTSWLIYKVNDPKPDNINVFSYSNKNK